MRTHLVFLTGLATALCACAGLAVAGDNVDPSQASLTSDTFVAKAAQAGMMEVELGNMALSKSQNAQVRLFAGRMVKDHGKANEDLKGLAQGKNVSVPDKLDIEHRGMVEMLRGKSGADFDAQYAQHMSKDHDKAIALFTGASRSTSLDQDLAAFAKKTLPTLEEHKKLADDLAKSRTAAAKNPEAPAKTY